MQLHPVKTVNDIWTDAVKDLVGLRKAQKISQAELAFRIGCEPSFIHKLEREKRYPSHHLLVTWIHALEAKIEIKTK